MSKDQSPSGGYRNNRLRSERDPVIDDGERRRETSDDAAPAADELPEVSYGQNEMSKAWARESYRADYGRASEARRNEFGRKRVEDADEAPERE
ncbi:hypothetical protein ABID21_003131 [Pseudorhizobium tarimense]|uniref:Uncharacterized protein n=1 Tax=Pseudorhizobium tarimense TaxID=1079109 RepID=A0ABV2H8Y4_9HYPH|nr:hypothetical protein [Pseudorhizobium tarimense]MCJ8520131.1 hypothetical protein [Pseudorhizobium tarimense]